MMNLHSSNDAVTHWYLFTEVHILQVQCFMGIYHVKLLSYNITSEANPARVIGNNMPQFPC